MLRTPSIASGSRSEAMTLAQRSMPGKSWRGKDAPTTRRVAALTLALFAFALALDAGWLHAKAWLAQQLLQHAWSARTAQQAPRPWPWADTRPVARLLAPGRGIDQIVLAGDAGRSLAFGPGWAEASAVPGSQGVVVISGHRDTHFGFLRALRAGDPIELEAQASHRHYRVLSTRVADTRDERLALEPGADLLQLVTCYPFDAISAGGPLRYVVTLQPDEA